jgi:hypothetical protein
MRCRSLLDGLSWSSDDGGGLEGEYVVEDWNDGILEYWVSRAFELQ